MKKRYETKLTEECLDNLNELRALYKVKHLNEVIEIIVREKIQEKRKQQVEEYMKIYGGTYNEMGCKNNRTK